MAASDSTIEMHKTHLEAFLNVATAATTGTSPSTASYTASSSTSSKSTSRSWSTFSLKEMTISPIYIFSNLPACRVATLEFFASLIREHVNIFFTNLENKDAANDFGNMDDALNEIGSAMQQDLRELGSQACQQIFEWSLDNLAEISKKNVNRRVFATGNEDTLSDTLQTYTSCRSTRVLLELLNSCVERLLEMSPERCIAGLLDITARFGNHCDWILTFIGTKHPKTIIDHLLTIGATDFQNYVTEMIGKLSTTQVLSRQDQYQREKLMSLSSIIGHLAHQQGAELRRQLAAIIQHGLRENATQRQHYAMIFIIKTASLSKDVADLLLQDLHSLVTADNIAIISRVFSQIPQVIVFGDQNPAHVLMNVIMVLKETTVGLLYDKILRLAFDELKSERRDSRTNSYVIQSYAMGVLDVLTSNMERQIHNSVNFGPDSTPLLNEIDHNLPAALERLFSTNEIQRKYYFKFLVLLCFVKGESKTIEILANVLFHAANEEQLSLFVSFCRILHPVHVRVVEQLFRHLPRIYERFRALPSYKSMRGFEENEWLWLENFCTLVHWDQANTGAAGKEVDIVNLIEIISNHYSEIVEYLLPLIVVPSCSRPVLDILMKIGQPVHQQPRIVVRSITLCCSLTFDVFDRLGKYLASGDGLDLAKAFTDYFVAYVHSQLPYAVETALRLLLTKLVSHSSDDTGIRKPFDMFALTSLSATLESELDSCKSDNTLSTSIMSMTEERDKASLSFNETSMPLLVGNRNTGFAKIATNSNGGTPLDLVHRGVIRRRFPLQLDNAEKDEILHKGILFKLAYVRLIDRLCYSSRGPSATSAGPTSSVSTYSLDACRILAQLMTDTFCPDAIAADFVWDDWELSKNLMERFLAAAKRIDECPVFWDLMTIVSEAYPCLWFCLPLIKAIMGSAITQCENAIDKMNKIQAKLLKTMEKLFLVLFKGRILPKQLASAADLLKHVKQYEGACVLGEIWRYIKIIAPDTKTLQHHFEYVQCRFGGPLEYIKGDHTNHLETLLLVVEANIAEAGYLLEKFVDLK